MSSVAADSTPIPIARRIRIGVPSRKGVLRTPAIQWLHLPRGWPKGLGLVPVSRRDLDLDLVHAELDELLRVAAAINDGYGSATYLLERLGVTERKRCVFYRAPSVETSRSRNPIKSGR
jgi:Tn3 transposase DDE domain